MSIEILEQAGMLSGEDGALNLDLFNLVIKIPRINLPQAAETLVSMHKAGLLSGEDGRLNRDALIQAAPAAGLSFSGVGIGLLMLHEAGMLSGEERHLNRANFVSLIQPAPDGLHPISVARALIKEEIKMESACHVHVLAQATRDRKSNLSKLSIDLIGRISACLFNSTVSDKRLAKKIMEINSSENHSLNRRYPKLR